LLLGSNATSSARFAFTNVAGGTPTASLSAGSAGGAYLTATGTLSTTANQTLTLGGSTNGNIVFNPLNGTGFSIFNGRLGVNTTSPLANLDVQGNLGTVPVASLSGDTSMPGLIVDNSGTGALITASTSGRTRFLVDNGGNVGIGTSSASQITTVGDGKYAIITATGAAY